MKTTLGLMSKMRAKATRCCSPGESTLIQSDSSSRRSTRCASDTFSRISRKASSENVPDSAG
ncbi:Protein of uncharacterised function (DUF1602) [Mycobacteroides abscessus subsp. abscessus]|nr:Protein of uncharacterised function (DUF1602) [Mycobacteroides abscessus subsp. abscessus]